MRCSSFSPHPTRASKQPRTSKDGASGCRSGENVQIDFSRAQAIRGLENALRLEGLEVPAVQLVDYVISSGQSDAPAERIAGTQIFSGRGSRGGQARELVGLLRGEVDAIFLKGASAAHLANLFGLRTVIDTGSHPEPLIRANNGTPRTLTVDRNLIENHFDAAVRIVEQVLRAEDWAHAHPEETRQFLGRESNSSEYWVAVAYGQDAHLRLRTNLLETSVTALQDFTNFLHRWQFIPNAVDVRSWIDARAYQAALESRGAQDVAA